MINPILYATQNLVATNDCDESGNGDNNANCSITSTNHIGAVSQLILAVQT
jgi:hypothetical protein